MRYFHISNGLRGCYLPDNSFVVAVPTRRELKQIVESECDNMREAFGFGGSRKEIAAEVAFAWRYFRKTFCIAIPFGRSRSTTDRPFGVFIMSATRDEYLEYQQENN